MKLEVTEKVLSIDDVEAPNVFDTVRAMLKTLQETKALDRVQFLNMRDVHPQFENKFMVELAGLMGRLFTVVSTARGNEDYTVLMSFSHEHPPRSVFK